MSLSSPTVLACAPQGRILVAQAANLPEGGGTTSMLVGLTQVAASSAHRSSAALRPHRARSLRSFTGTPDKAGPVPGGELTTDDRSSHHNEQHRTTLEHQPGAPRAPRCAIRSETCMHLLIAELPPPPSPAED